MLGSMVAIAAVVPRDPPPRRVATAQAPAAGGAERSGYAAVWRDPTFRRFAPMGFFHYGGLIAVQSLWAGPWLVDVCGWSDAAAARGLFAINLAMLASFLVWGSLVPKLYAGGWTAQRLVARGVPLSLATLALAIGLGSQGGAWVWALFCVSCTVVSLTQPAVGLALPAALAGRALSAFNLLIFVGVFTLQWGLGLAIDLLRNRGWETLSAYQGAFALWWSCCAAAYLWFLRRREVHGRAADSSPA